MSERRNWILTKLIGAGEGAPTLSVGNPEMCPERAGQWRWWRFDQRHVVRDVSGMSARTLYAHLSAERLVRVCIAIDRDCCACAVSARLGGALFVLAETWCRLLRGSLTDVDQAFEAVGDLVIVWCEFLAVSTPARQERSRQSANSWRTHDDGDERTTVNC